MTCTDRHGQAENPAYNRHARGPNGRRTCRRCLAEVPKGRSTFCSDACVEDFQIRTGSSSWVRPIVFRRDGGVCSACGLRTAALKRLFRWAYRGNVKLTATEKDRAIAVVDNYKGKRMGWYRAYSGHALWKLAVLVRLGWSARQATNHRDLWDADHIVPVVEGGGGCGLGNYRTLCVPCHSGETAKLAARLADRRRNHHPTTLEGIG